MRAIGKLIKLGGEIELTGTIFYMANRETGKITKEKREVFIGLCFGNKLITRDYITSALQLIKRSSVGVRELFLTFTNAVSLETAIRRLEQGVPPLGNA